MRPDTLHQAPSSAQLGGRSLAAIEHNNAESNNATCLADYLQSWWSQSPFRLKTQVRGDVFASKLADWLEQQG